MSHEYLPFAFEPDANVLPQAEWVTLAERPIGFKRGIAVSKWFNKAWRQTSVMTAAIAAFIDAHVADDVLDDGDVEALAKLLADAIAALVGGMGISGGGVIIGPTAPINPGPGTLWWDTSDAVLKLWSGNLPWIVTSGGAATGTDISPPANPRSGQLWFDPVTTQLFVHYGGAWVIAVNPGMDGGHYP